MPKPRFTWSAPRGEENRAVLALLHKLAPGTDRDFKVRLDEITAQTKLTPGNVTLALLRLQEAGEITCKIARSKNKLSRFRILRAESRNASDQAPDITAEPTSPLAPFPPDPLSPQPPGREINKFLGEGEDEGEGSSTGAVRESTPEPASPDATSPAYPRSSTTLAARIAFDLDDLKHIDGYHKLAKDYPEAALTDAWHRTAEVPRSQIRKAPFNLFRWFLRKHWQADSTQSNHLTAYDPNTHHHQLARR